jgi:hypothetical protein
MASLARSTPCTAPSTTRTFFRPASLPPARFPAPSPRRRSPAAPPPRGVGKDAVGSWLDLAGFVAATSQGSHTPFDDLADKIGKDCYLDVGGWRLFLKDLKAAPGAPTTMAQALARQLGSSIQGQGFNAAAVEELVRRVPVTLGSGTTKVALADIMPARCLSDLLEICERYARDL